MLGEVGEIARREQVDLVLVAGDLYETASPSAEAEQRGDRRAAGPPHGRARRGDRRQPRQRGAVRGPAATGGASGDHGPGPGRGATRGRRRGRRHAARRTRRASRSSRSARPGTRCARPTSWSSTPPRRPASTRRASPRSSVRCAPNRIRTPSTCWWRTAWCAAERSVAVSAWRRPRSSPTGSRRPRSRRRSTTPRSAISTSPSGCRPAVRSGTRARRCRWTSAKPVPASTSCSSRWRRGPRHRCGRSR